MQDSSTGISVFVIMILVLMEPRVRLNAIWYAVETLHKCVAEPIETQFGPPIVLQVGTQIQNNKHCFINIILY